MFYVVVRLFIKFLLKIFFRLECTGRENIPVRGGFILASNHASYLDPPLLGVSSFRKLSYFAKEDLFKNPVFGWIIRHLNSFPVKLRSADIKALRSAIEETENGNGVLIFPEGARTWDGNLGAPLPGIGLVAAKSGVAVVPAYVQGSYQAMPRGSKFIRPGKIKVHFGRPFKVSDLMTDKKGVDLYRYIAQITMQEIAKIKNACEK